MLCLTSFHDDKEKVDFLISSHFRHNRMFRPNRLKASLLRHQLDCLWPNYFSFNHTLDEPTASVANYAKGILKRRSKEHMNELNRKWDDLINFNKGNFEKHYGDRRTGFVSYGQSTPEEARGHKLMTLLLLEKAGYIGCPSTGIV
jgi:hypothetical protein